MQLQNIRMWIARNIDRLIRTFHREFSALIITGARQTGKTSILRHIFPEASYVSLDDPDQAANAENSPKEFLENLKTPAIIDEAQYAPSLFRFLKIHIDRSKKKGLYLLTGSQQFSLMKNVSESLAGRCGVIHLYTLAAGELQAAIPSIKIEEIILKGGYPELYSGKHGDGKHWFPSYLSTYLERDVRNTINIAHLRDFNLFMRALALRTGQVLSLSGLARDVGVAPNTIKSWLSVLEASQHIYLLSPYHRNIGKRLVKSPKIYFCDTGLAVYLMGLKSWNDVRDSLYAGSIWETFVFNQILKHLVNKGEASPNIWFWRTNIGEEVDFLIEKGGRFIAVESKLTENPSVNDIKGFKALQNYYGENCIIKSILACKVGTSFKLDKETLVSNFLDCKILD